MLPSILISILSLVLQFLSAAAFTFVAVIYFLGSSATRRIDRERGVVRLTLPTSAQHLKTEDVWRLALTALLKHILAFTGWNAPLEPGGRGFKLPHVEIEGQLDITSDDVKAFGDAVSRQKPTGEDDGSLSPFFLVALTVPLTIQILASNSCPIKPLGAVNTKNVFKIHDPSLCRDVSALQAKNVTYKTVFGGPENPGHRRKRGVEFCITIDILLEGKLILSQELWYLQFLPASYEPKYKADLADGNLDSSKTEGTKQDRSQSLDIDMNDPKKWAACCKDYNPIHVNKSAAKIFGFRSVIAHGNHVVALVVEQLLRQDLGTKASAQKSARKLCWQAKEPFTIEVSFSRPLLLPARAAVSWETDSMDRSKSRFSVSAKNKSCMSGSIGALGEK